MDPAGASMLSVNDVHKSFAVGPHRVEVLRGVSFAMREREALAITGPSGAGKSTLLHLIGTLDRPTSGSIVIDGREPHMLAERDLAAFRNRSVGFVFQDAHLLPQYTVLENVMIPALALPGKPDELEPRARELLDRVGLAARLDHRPAQLSGGERQRVAVARALINRPTLLLCDEPTGNLDRQAADGVAALLFELHEAIGSLLITVTHSNALAQRFARRFELVEGRCSAP
jgi:lipoprotein-releasing system ATP-binding protein